ncbi:unnamed protein product [Pleuronectes platessa]|uniref:Uncharacterized protein n=1 Tax=Pleuronectes platessa TaxID=8262 RepID=A0A9N7VFV1_PLEPL|nr:unnamed protein product [Pleuronectes platessa]
MTELLVRAVRATMADGQKEKDPLTENEKTSQIEKPGVKNGLSTGWFIQHETFHSREDGAEEPSGYFALKARLPGRQGAQNETEELLFQAEEAVSAHLEKKWLKLPGGGSGPVSTVMEDHRQPRCREHDSTCFPSPVHFSCGRTGARPGGRGPVVPADSRSLPPPGRCCVSSGIMDDEEPAGLTGNNSLPRGPTPSTGHNAASQDKVMGGLTSLELSPPSVFHFPPSPSRS